MAKLVVVKGERVLASPYRHRRHVEACVSLAPRALEIARAWGARRWLLRFDLEGRCLSLDLHDVERSGWLRNSDGHPEWFVELSAFAPCPWPDWAYVPDEEAIALDEEQPAPREEQLALFGAVP